MRSGFFCVCYGTHQNVSKEDGRQRQMRIGDSLETDKKPCPSARREEPSGPKAGPEHQARRLPFGRAITHLNLLEPDLSEPSLTVIR